MLWSAVFNSRTSGGRLNIKTKSFTAWIHFRRMTFELSVRTWNTYRKPANKHLNFRSWIFKKVGSKLWQEYLNMDSAGCCQRWRIRRRGFSISGHWSPAERTTRWGPSSSLCWPCVPVSTWAHHTVTYLVVHSLTQTVCFKALWCVHWPELLCFSASWCNHWAAAIWSCWQQTGSRNRSDDPVDVPVSRHISAASDHTKEATTGPHRPRSSSPWKTSQRGTNRNTFTYLTRYLKQSTQPAVFPFSFIFLQ